MADLAALRSPMEHAGSVPVEKQWQNSRSRMMSWNNNHSHSPKRPYRAHPTHRRSRRTIPPHSKTTIP